MAKFSYNGVDELANALKKIENPDEACQRVLNSMGEVVKDKIVEIGRKRMGAAKFLESIWLKNPKKESGGWSTVITFRGIQHKKRARNAEIAFINEFGLESHGNKANGYFSEAIEKSEKEAVAAGELAFEYWLAINGF